MTKDKSIFIKNIYYMLAYAFQVLKQKNYEDIDSEDFDNIQDLFAAILSHGISQQIKQGLYREYISQRDDLTTLRGKLDIHGTIRRQIENKKVLSCEYDELSENNKLNQILKTTAMILIREKSVKVENRAALKKAMLYFDGIDVIDPSGIRWDMIRYQRNNKSYEMLINICYFVLDGLIQTTEKGDFRMKELSDEHMAKLYEKFVLEYYRQNHRYLSEVRPAQVAWDIPADTDDNMVRFLPVMLTDIFLKKDDTILIIDTKYYGKALAYNQFDKATLHSANMYQIFTYVKNQTAKGGTVSGMLLYAKTDEAISPDVSFMIGGNKFSVRTLDLNTDFKLICAQLDQIAEEHFGSIAKKAS